MRLSYDDIELELLHISAWLREFRTTRDETTPLYLRHYIRCTCWLNPNLTAAKNFPDFVPPDCVKANPPWKNPAVPVKIKAVKGSKEKTCVKTDIELVDRLSQPRRKLKIWMDSKINAETADAAQEVMLESPIGDFTIDALNGPQCKVLNVIPVAGDYSLCLELEFETHMPVCPTNLSPIISNRWSCTVDHHPENHLAIHVYEGEAVFRMDVLKKGGNTVDLLRPLMMIPIPPNFQRYPVRVNLWPGGNGCEYVVVEEERSVNFPGGVKYNATDIDVVEERMYYQPSSPLGGEKGPFSNFFDHHKKKWGK